MQSQPDGRVDVPTLERQLEEQRRLRAEADMRLLMVETAIRDLRAAKTPATWTEHERALFKLLPEAKRPDDPHGHLADVMVNA